MQLFITQSIDANMSCSARGLGEQVVRSLIEHGALVSVGSSPLIYINSCSDFCN